MGADEAAVTKYEVGELVGRDREVSLLESTLDAAQPDRATLTLVVGQAGIGKSRLVDEAAARARAKGMQVLRGEVDVSRPEPMELWRGVYRSVGMVPSADPSLPPAERRWEQLDSLVDALIRCAPVLVVLEDLHWADAGAVWVLERLPRALGGERVAIIATSRDHEPDMPRLDGLHRVAGLVPLDGLGVEAVAQLAAAEVGRPVDGVALHDRTGGNPLFVKELVRSPGGSGVIEEVLEHSLERFEPDTRELLATAAVAGADTPLALIGLASSCSTTEAAERLAPALRAGVLDGVEPSRVRFHHALLSEAAGALGDRRARHERLAAAWDTVAGVDGEAESAGHRLRGAVGTPGIATEVETARGVAGRLVEDGQHQRALALLQTAHGAASECVDQPGMRAAVALDLAKALRELGDLEAALNFYQEAAELAHASSEPLIRARAEIGANLWVTAFVPDPPRMRRLEDALDALPPDEIHLRSRLLGRLAVVGGADVEGNDRVRAWADEALELARTTGDPVLIAQSLLNQTMAPATRADLDERISAADEVVHLAEHVGRSDLALHGQQRRVCHHLNHGDVAAANQSLARAELLAELLPSPGWRQRTLVQRTTLFALTGHRMAASAAMHEAVRVGVGHVEPTLLYGCEAMHQLMLLDLYGHADEDAEEPYRRAAEMVETVPSPVLQVNKGFGAQLFGDESGVEAVLQRYATRPEELLRSMTGDSLLRVLGDIVARAGATGYAATTYRALLPFAGLLNVGGGHSVGLPVDDVLSRLAALDGDVTAAVRHGRDAVTLARSIPSTPLLVHCLHHLADAVERAGDGSSTEDPRALRGTADDLAGEAGIVCPGREQQATTTTTPGAPRSASMRRDGPMWVLSSPLGDARLIDSHGLGQLARLLTTPAVEVTALELAGRASVPVAADLGPILDGQAKRAYRARLLQLQAEVDDAEVANDPVRGEQAQVEMDALLRELKRAVGLGGRDRPTGSDAERARVNVVRSLRRAIVAVADQAPLLGGHLEEAVRTGGHCIYLPEPTAALTWTVLTAEA